MSEQGPTTLTFSSSHHLEVDDIVTWYERERWWQRLGRWIMRRPRPLVTSRIIAATGTTAAIEPDFDRVTLRP